MGFIHSLPRLVFSDVLLGSINWGAASNEMKTLEFWQNEANYLDNDLPEVSSHTFYSPPLTDTSVVIDLGGATAAFSHALASTYGCCCHVVEATSHNIERIKETDLIRKYHYAISGDDKPVTLHIADDEYHWGSIDLPPGFNSVATEKVRGITLERFLNEIECLEPDLVKVDIEGAEIEMFDSSSDEIIQNVGQFTVEFHDFLDISFKEKISRILARFISLGFFCVIFTRKYHGDVLFINPRKISINPIKKYQIRYLTKYTRGVMRIARRIK